MKQAHFDVTHELDEFLMVEKPLTRKPGTRNAVTPKETAETSQWTSISSQFMARIMALMGREFKFRLW